jgi:hypothetical protein
MLRLNNSIPTCQLVFILLWVFNWAIMVKKGGDWL